MGFARRRLELVLKPVRRFFLKAAGAIVLMSAIAVPVDAYLHVRVVTVTM